MWNAAQLPEFKVFGSSTRKTGVERRRRRERSRKEKKIWGTAKGRKGMIAACERGKTSGERS